METIFVAVSFMTALGLTLATVLLLPLPARAHVDPRFREKYGIADRWRAWRDGNDTIPIRLQPR